LRFASFETPQIDAKMHFNVFDPALIALAGPNAAVAASENSASDEGDGDEALPLNAIRAIDTRATLSIDRASFSGHSVKNMQVNMRAVDGVVRINALTGTVHGGKLDMKANFNAKHNIAKLTTIGSVTSLDLAEALAAMDAEPIMTGKADLQWKLSSKGATSNQLTKAMKGPIDLETRQVVLNDLGIEKMLCESVALVNRETLSATLPESTQFENLSVKLKMNQGKLQMNPFRAELQNVALQGQGALDLLQQDFKATFTASLSAGLGELDPACRVNDRITAIGWPVNCKGSLAGDPADWCAVDSSKIIEDLAAGEVQRQIEKEGSKLLKKLFN
jgi:AsmA protein